MKLKKYKAEFIVEKIYDVEVEMSEDIPHINVADEIIKIIKEDYLVGNMKDEEKDCQFKIDEIKEIN